MLVLAPHLVCALLLSALLPADSVASSPPQCIPWETPNMAIDVISAVAKGAQFTDPVKATSAEECVSACCSGDWNCNFIMYDTHNKNPVQNCYLFLCPGPRSCPMTPSAGVHTYSIWTGKEKSDPNSTKADLTESSKNDNVHKSPSKKPSSAVPATVSAQPELEGKLSQQNLVKKISTSDVPSHIKTSEEDKADIPHLITSQLLHLANDIDKQLEKIEAGSKEGNDSEPVELSISSTGKPLVEPTPSFKHINSKKLSSDTKDVKPSTVAKKKPETLEVHYPTPKVSTSSPSVRTQSLIPNTKPTIILTTVPSKQQNVGKLEPSSSTKNILSRHNSANSFHTVSTVKATRAGHLIVTTQVPTTSAIHQAKSALPVTQHKPSQTSLLMASKSTFKAGDLFTSKNVQEAVLELTSPEWREPPSPAGDIKDSPRNLDSLRTLPGSTDKSGLVAALVFGVMFLVLVIGLVSQKVSEARRRHQYTKLDYLINGMYVDT